MNKYKKRLAKLLVPILALSGINISAMENIQNPIVRKKSAIKQRYKQQLKNLQKYSKERILRQDKRFERIGKASIFAYGGFAYDDFCKEYRLIDQFRNVMNKYELGGTTGYKIASGCYGAVVPCCDIETGEQLAVKCEMNSSNNKDTSNENRFYEDAKKWWVNASWYVPLVRQFSDDMVTYTVTKWVNGKTLGSWFEDLGKSHETLTTKIRKLASIVKKINQFMDDLTVHSCYNWDLHDENIMITTNEVLKIVDHGKYNNNVPKDRIDHQNAVSMISIISDAMIKLGLSLGNGFYATGPKFEKNDTYSMKENKNLIWKTMVSIFNSLGRYQKRLGGTLLVIPNFDYSNTYAARHNVTSILYKLSESLNSV